MDILLHFKLLVIGKKEKKEVKPNDCFSNLKTAPVVIKGGSMGVQSIVITILYYIKWMTLYLIA